jgi:hypothetical protein
VNSKIWPLAPIAVLCLAASSPSSDGVSPAADFIVIGGVHDRISSGETVVPITVKAALSKGRNVRLDIGKNRKGEIRSGVVVLLRERAPGKKALIAYDDEEMEVPVGKAAVFYWERSLSIHRPLRNAVGTVEVLEDDRQSGTLLLLNVTFTDEKRGNVRVIGTARLPPDRQIRK